MEKKTKRIALLIFYFTTLLISCSKNEKSGLTQPVDQSQRVLAYIKSLGYPSSSIVDNGSQYVVQGDIAFRKDMKVPDIQDRAALTEQLYTGNLVDWEHQFNVKVRIDPTISAQTPQINDAINLWNNAISNLQFSVVTSGEDILIRNTGVLGVNVCGQGTFPPGNGLAGNIVEINAGEVANQSYGQQMINVAHELGHCIGFTHTNQNFGIAVPGYGSSDANSIMKGNCCGSLPTVLSYYDIGALRKLYTKELAPNSTIIDITPPQFILRWSKGETLSANFIGWEINYNGFSGINFGGTLQLPPSTTSFVIPGITTNPSSGSTQTGVVRLTVTAKYAGGRNYIGPLVSRYKSNGVWQ